MLAAQNVRIHRRPDFSFIAYALARRLDRDMYKMIMALGGATISLLRTLEANRMDSFIRTRYVLQVSLALNE